MFARKCLIKLEIVTKPPVKRLGGGQPGRMGMTATPKSKDGAYWTHREGKEFEGSHCKCFDHHPFYVGYILNNVIYSPMIAANQDQNYKAGRKEVLYCKSIMQWLQLASALTK